MLPQSQSPLMRLPRELRDEIYKLVLVKRFSISQLPKQSLALVRACRQINEEAQLVFYKYNKFLLYCGTDQDALDGRLEANRRLILHQCLQRFLKCKPYLAVEQVDHDDLVRLCNIGNNRRQLLCSAKLSVRTSVQYPNAALFFMLSHCHQLSLTISMSAHALETMYNNGMMRLVHGIPRDKIDLVMLPRRCPEHKRTHPQRIPGSQSVRFRYATLLMDLRAQLTSPCPGRCEYHGQNDAAEAQSSRFKVKIQFTECCMYTLSILQHLQGFQHPIDRPYI